MTDSLLLEQDPKTNTSTISVLRNRNFRLLWIGEGISLLGDQFYLIALPWLVLSLTGDALAVGTVLATAGIPRALFMLVGGALTDRFTPCRLMINSNLARMALTALLAALVATNLIQLWMLYISALLFGLADAFFFPAQTSIVPKLVDRDQLQAGNAVIQGTAHLSLFIGPVVAGLLVSWLDGGAAHSTVGIALAIAIDSLSFLASVTALRLIRKENLMKTISLESAPVAKTSLFKSSLAVFFQWLGAFVGFIASMIIADMLSPLPAFIMENTPESGFMSQGAAMLFNGAVNATIMLWAARRSSLKGFALFGQLFVLLFGVQIFQTQIETGYFISAFPLLHGNFELYHLILRGAITSALFVLLLVWMTGGFSRKERASTNFTVVADKAVKAGAWLAATYFVLYLLFGYYVAWQSQELRLFYGGPAELNSFADQILGTLMVKPEMPFFQYARGILWILCLIPLFKGFTGGRVELVVLSALALALLPTTQLAFANPLMPAEISLYHFWETSISTGIFGALCAWFVPMEKA